MSRHVTRPEQPPDPNIADADFPDDGRGELPDDCTMSNCGHSIDAGFEESLRAGTHWGRHSGWDFNGRVWFADGWFYEQVWVYGSVRATYRAETLEELMRVVNDRYGWG